jgi:hypothetical protein
MNTDALAFLNYQPAKNQIKSKSQPIRILLESSAEMETSCDDDAVVYFGPLLWPTTTHWPLLISTVSTNVCLPYYEKNLIGLLCVLCVKQAETSISSFVIERKEKKKLRVAFKQMRL